MLHSFAYYPAPHRLAASHLDEFFGQTEPCLARDRCGPPKKGAQMWAESHHCRCTVDGCDRLSILSSSILVFSATYIDHALASALLFRLSSPQVGDSGAQIHRLRERKEQQGDQP